MLKRSAMLVLLLALAPVPGQSSEVVTQSYVNGKIQRSNTPPQSNGSDNAVTIAKLPAVSVAKSWQDTLSLIFSGVLVLIGIGGVWYARKTLRVIQGQLAEIRAAGLQTDRMIGHAANQAAAIVATSDAAKLSAEAAAKAADAVQTSANAYQTAERAWMTWTQVIIDNFLDSTDIATGERNDWTNFRFQWINSGHTPAISCSFLCDGKVVAGVNNPTPTFTPPPIPQERRVPIVPGIKVSSSGKPFRKEDIEALRKRECQIFLYGRAVYDIVYPTGVPLHTEVCLEVAWIGTETTTGKPKFSFSPIGPQNSAT